MTFLVCIYLCMKKIIITVLLWSLVVGMMALILYMSSEPAEKSNITSGGALEIIYDATHEATDSTHEQKVESFVDNNQGRIRRAAHFGIFMLLGVLLSVATLYSIKKIWIRATLPFAVALLFPFIDELYQISIPGRAFEWKDVGLDILGGIIGCALVYLIFVIVKVVKREKHHN